MKKRLSFVIRRFARREFKVWFLNCWAVGQGRVGYCGRDSGGAGCDGKLGYGLGGRYFLRLNSVG